MNTILDKNNPVLRKIAIQVPIADITSPAIQKIISKMSAILAKEDDGVAIAAPQIGESIRIFIVSGRLLWYMQNEEINGVKKEEPKIFPPDVIFINPKIIKLSKEKKWTEEGCLSVRYLYGKMKRSTKATIRAYNEKGKSFERGASGVLAQVFQHETDHLDGKLFIDKAKDIVEFPPEQFEKK